VAKISEKQVLQSIEALGNKINSLIEEKDRLYVEYQSLKEDNEELEKELQLLQSQKERAKMKAEDILQRINEIEPSA
jgi:FtsZ-binding cell division protein ZapB|tara:strand:- start:1428 stop:1658 length:231 start_codon:yes stop_codon:yes gene_type:complete